MTTSDTNEELHRCPECGQSGTQVYGEVQCGDPLIGLRLAGLVIYECEDGHSWTYSFDKPIG